ncbi:hypothetical protein D3C79_969390 [compost metagenome]
MFAAKTGDCKHRAKNFITRNAHGIIYLGQNGRAQVADMAVLWVLAAVQEQRGTLAQALLDIVGHFLAVALVDQGAHHRRRIERIARREGCRMPLQRQ